MSDSDGFPDRQELQIPVPRSKKPCRNRLAKLQKTGTRQIHIYCFNNLLALGTPSNERRTSGVASYSEILTAFVFVVQGERRKLLSLIQAQDRT